MPVGNDNIMEDLGAIVDGLIQNMEPGVMPEHLQRVIERWVAVRDCEPPLCRPLLVQ